MTPARLDQSLVFDVGLHNGDDTAYYLSLGYRVIGVEASPVLAERAKERFAEDIRQGRVIVVNAGVLRQPGVFTFYRNLVDDGWSSFEAERGARGEWEEILVRCVTTRSLFQEYGTPFFLKVDIEGADLQALDTLTPQHCPAYVSVELNVSDPILEGLIDLGYTAFKLVDGATFWPTTPIFPHHLGWRLLRQAGCIAPPIRSAIASLPEWLRRKSEWDPPGSPENYPFTRYSSGPFGEAAAGKWLSAAQALRRFRALADDYRRAGQEEVFWWDVHARHASWQASAIPKKAHS